MCFFNDTSSRLRWFGVFAQSSAGRILFFPSFTQGAHHLDARHQGETNILPEFDHFTLEKNRLKSHMTSRQSGKHLGSPRTMHLGKDRVLWMGLSINNAAILPEVRNETTVVNTCPPSDAKRRNDVFLKTREGAVFSIIALNDEHPITIDEEFLHFAIIAGPSGFETYTGTELGFPYRSPFLAQDLPERLSKLPVRSHRLALSDDTDIQITACHLPGKLKGPVAVTCPS